MSQPRLEACYFPAPSDSRWTRLAMALRASALMHCTGWTVNIRAIRPSHAQSAIGLRRHATNTQKLDHWTAQVVAAADGEQLLLMDADTVVLRPLDDLWEQAFDLAYTVRPPRAKFPLNGGVVGVRVSDRTRAFLTAWAEGNRRLLGERTGAYDWARRFGGVNQASLAPLLDQAEARGVEVRALPCAEWNCEDTTWAEFNPARTRILHVKDALRRMALGMEPPTPELAPLVALWRRYASHDIRRTA